MNSYEETSITEDKNTNCTGDCARCQMRYECEDSSIGSARQKKKIAKHEADKKKPKGSARWY